MSDAGTIDVGEAPYYCNQFVLHRYVKLSWNSDDDVYLMYDTKKKDTLLVDGDGDVLVRGEMHAIERGKGEGWSQSELIKWVFGQGIFSNIVGNRIDADDHALHVLYCDSEKGECYLSFDLSFKGDSDD